MVLGAMLGAPSAAVWGHTLVLGATATADLYTTPAKPEQLVSNFWDCE